MLTRSVQDTFDSRLVSCGDLKATFGAGLVCAAVAARQNNALRELWR